MNKQLFFVVLGLPVLLNAMQQDKSVNMSQAQYAQFQKDHEFVQAAQQYGKQFLAGVVLGCGIEGSFAYQSTEGFESEHKRKDRQPMRSAVFGIVPAFPVLYFSTEEQWKAQRWYGSAGATFAGYILATWVVNAVKDACQD